MKKLAFWNRYESLNPSLFSDPNAPIGDDLILPFNVLAIEAKKRGIECVTLDQVKDTKDLIGVVFLDRPVGNPTPHLQLKKVPIYLLAFENETILQENWINLGGFAKVFSWAQAFTLPRDRFVHLFPATRFPDEVPNVEDRRFCTMIAGNKRCEDARSLYPARAHVVETFGLDGGFDLYGPGWTASHLNWGWKGSIPPGEKRKVLSYYRFAIAFENARFDNYITEKLFDCFSAGVVPVYCGAPNIAEWVDPESFIDAAQFSGPVELIRYLRTLPEVTWRGKLEAAGGWMRSFKAKPFLISTFVNTILDGVMP